MEPAALIKKPKLGKRVCLCCDKEFTPKRSDQLFKDRKHAKRYHLSLHWHRTHKDYHGSRRLKIRYVHRCLESGCGKTFESDRSSVQYCEVHRIPRNK